MTQPKIKIMPFDPAKYLTDEEDISIFLAYAFESGDRDEIKSALSAGARARNRIRQAPRSPVEPFSRPSP